MWAVQPSIVAMKWHYRISICLKKTRQMHGIQTDHSVLAVEVVIPVLDGAAGVNADFLMEPFSERHMISFCTRKGSSTGTECCQQEQPSDC